MSITKTRAWVAGTVVACLLLTVAAWFLLIAPQRAEAADLRDQAVAAADNNALLELRIAELKAEFAELPQRQAELAVVKKALPEEAQMPTLVRDLDALAATSGVTLMSLTPSPAVPVVTAAPAAPATADPATPDPAADADSAAAPDAAPAAAATEALLSVPVSISVVGNFFNAEVFLRGLQEELSRDYLVNGLNVVAETAGEASGGKPAVNNGDVTMTVTGSVFVLVPGDASPAVDTASQVPGVPAETATN